MSFNTGLSGLNAARADLDVTSNNIANANTTAFKGSTATFADVFYSTQGGGSDKAGSGVRLAQINQRFDQGNIEDSSSNLHVALNGNGFFTLEGESGPVYSRDGAFLLDDEGFLVNSAGLKVQAFPTVETQGSDTSDVLFANGVLSSVKVDRGIGQPSATENINLSINFRADAAVRAAPAPEIDNTDPTTFDFTNTVTVYDSLGNSHNVELYVQRSANDTYSAKAYFNGTALEFPVFDVDPDPAVTTAGVLTETFELAFGPDGQLTNLNAFGDLTLSAGTLTAEPTDPDGLDGAAELTLNFDFTGSTMTGDSFAVTRQSQDGYTAGRPTGLDIDSDGTIIAGYSNGRKEVLGKIALANFDNLQGLQSIGDNGFVATTESGAANLGEAGSASFGAIKAGSLETSNVDISQQLVRLITAQRNFQASSRVISTNDQITQTAINLGR